MSFFSVNHISAGYRNTRVIKDVCFELESGQLMGILGANGSGKTTLLKAICGNLPHTGNVILEECNLETLSARQISQLCSYIPQRSGINIDISVLDVVLMGYNPRLAILEHPNTAMRVNALRALDQVGLAGKESINYMHLSEGQKQLCILARTLVADTRLLLLDEPESALDFRYRYRMLDILRQWVRENDRSVIMTLHDPLLALNYCDQLLLLKDGEVLGEIYPQRDSLEKMEQMLSKVYGAVSVHVCCTRNGRSSLVMLKEDGE